MNFVYSHHCPEHCNQVTFLPSRMASLSFVFLAFIYTIDISLGMGIILVGAFCILFLSGGHTITAFFNMGCIRVIIYDFFICTTMSLLVFKQPKCFSSNLFNGLVHFPLNNSVIAHLLLPIFNIFNFLILNFIPYTVPYVHPV